MKKIFKEWTKFQMYLLIFSSIILIMSGIISRSDYLTIICSLVLLLVVLTQAKGKVISQFLGIVFVVIYSIVAYRNRYYGEVIIYFFIMLPLFIAGIISWIKNIDEDTNRVKANEITIREWNVLIIISGILFVILYYILKYFNTAQLFISTLSMITSLFATYLLTRRSKYGFLFYIGNDIILFILWGVVVIQGNFSVLPLVINQVINMINDTYGWYSWNKISNSNKRS